MDHKNELGGRIGARNLHRALQEQAVHAENPESLVCCFFTRCPTRDRILCAVQGEIRIVATLSVKEFSKTLSRTSGRIDLLRATCKPHLHLARLVYMSLQHL